jgi:uncharacterized membrane protein
VVFNFSTTQEQDEMENGLWLVGKKVSSSTAKIYQLTKFNNYLRCEKEMRETRKRSLFKSISWRLICIVVSIVTSFLLTGKWDIAVAIGTVYNAITIILYYFHERGWDKIQWGCVE